MKTELKFTFGDDDDRDTELYYITNARNFYFSLYDLDQELRSLVKYDKAEAEGLDPETLDHVRGMIRSFMSEHGVDFEHIQ